MAGSSNEAEAAVPYCVPWSINILLPVARRPGGRPGCVVTLLYARRRYLFIFQATRKTFTWCQVTGMPMSDAKRHIILIAILHDTPLRSSSWVSSSISFWPVIHVHIKCFTVESQTIVRSYICISVFIKKLTLDWILKLFSTNSLLHLSKCNVWMFKVRPTFWEKPKVQKPEISGFRFFECSELMIVIV